jgi:hypothetical protein
VRRLAVIAGGRAGQDPGPPAATAAGSLLEALYSVSFRQCWDAGACLSYVLDPGGYSCSAPPCGVGTDPASDCPAVPAPPF